MTLVQRFNTFLLPGGPMIVLRLLVSGAARGHVIGAARSGEIGHRS